MLLRLLLLLLSHMIILTPPKIRFYHLFPNRTTPFSLDCTHSDPRPILCSQVSIIVQQKVTIKCEFLFVCAKTIIERIVQEYLCCKYGELYLVFLD